MTPDVIASILIISGALFTMIAGLGVLRMPDLYMRMHASTKAGTLGLMLICVALMFVADDWVQMLKALFVTVFMIATAPVGSHLIGRAAFRRNLRTVEGTRISQECEEFRDVPGVDQTGAPSQQDR